MNTLTDLARFQVDTPHLDQRRFAFPNGHEASVILAPGWLFRFEVWSTDPADAATWTAAKAEKEN